MLGEVIRWGPLGPGGDPAASLQSWVPGVPVSGVSGLHDAYMRLRDGTATMNFRGPALGQLEMESFEHLSNVLAGLNTLYDLVTEAITKASAAGIDVSYFDTEITLVLDVLFELTTSLDSMTEQDIPGFQAKAATATNAMNNMIKQLSAAMQGRQLGGQMTGMLWGAGVVAALGVVGFLVWQGWRR